MAPYQEPIRGRGTTSNPANRFELIHYEQDDSTQEEDASAPATRFYRDHARSILTHNDSPDVGFEASINPYRGCENGCIYRYARPTHEYLGFSAGLDFETKIFVKADAPALLRKELASAKWQPKVVSLSGVTDPYQPIERRLGLTRRLTKAADYFAGAASSMWTSNVAGATLPSFHAGKETVTLAFPLAASAGTRTGP